MIYKASKSQKESGRKANKDAHSMFCPGLSGLQTLYITLQRLHNSVQQSGECWPNYQTSNMVI